MSEPTAGQLAERHDAVHPSADHQGHNTTPGGWATVAVIIAGFIVGGIGLIEWQMVVFWVGVGVVAAGFVLGWAVGIMSQVTEYGSGVRGGDPGGFDHS